MTFLAGFILGLVCAGCAAIAAFDHLRDEIKELRIIREDLTRKLAVSMGRISELKKPSFGTPMIEKEN